MKLPAAYRARIAGELPDAEAYFACLDAPPGSAPA